MLKRKHIIWVTVVVLYLVTWVGGWISQSREVKCRAEATYQAIQREFENLISEYDRFGANEDEYKDLSEKRKRLLFEDGPKARVWCLPILPGILLSVTAIQYGPRAGGGDFNIVIYYCFGSRRVQSL